MKNHPRVKTVLDRMYHGRVLTRVLAESPLFEFMSPGERQRIASRFELMKVPEGIQLVEQGSDDGALFLVKQGGSREELSELVAEYPKLREVLEPFHLDRVVEAVQRANARA